MSITVKSAGGGGITSSDVSALQNQVLYGASTITNDSNDEVVQGSMPNNGAVSETLGVQGASYTIPLGYHNGEGTVTASINNGVITSGAGSAIVGSPTYNSTTEKFVQNVSGTVAAPIVGTAGYVSSTLGTKNTNVVTGTKELDKISIIATNTGTTTTTPAISRLAKETADTWTDAGNGVATTINPSSGVYVKVQSAKNTGTLTATPSVAVAGYGTNTTGEHTATPAQSEVGANASLATYVPIKTTTPQAGSGILTLTPGAGSVSSSATNVVITEESSQPSSGYYITSTGSGTVNGQGSGTVVVNENGWVSGNTYASLTDTDSETSNTATKYYSIATNTITGSVDSLTAPSVAVSGAATGFTPSVAATSYYVTINGAGTDGSVKGKATAGSAAGVVAANATNVSDATTITPGITGSGDKVYIPTYDWSYTTGLGCK